MPEYSVAAYTMKIRHKGSSSADGDRPRLDSFGPGGHDVLQFLYALCQSATATSIRHKAEEEFLRVLRVDGVDRVVRVEIESGSHGYASRLVDVEENVETYQRKPTDAELLPLRNVFVSPVGSPTGLFITERVGIRGLRSTLVPVLQRCFAREYPDFTLDVEPLAPEEAVRKSLQAGDVKGVRLVRYGVPADQMNTYLRLLRPGGTVVLEDPDWSSWHFNPPAPALEQLIALSVEAFRRWGDADAGRNNAALLRAFDIEPRVRAEVLALPPGHPYLRLPLQLAEGLEPRLLELADAAELERLHRQAEIELATSGRWGTTFALLQCWGRSFIRRNVHPTQTTKSPVE